jgi:DNA mismatch endonuclease (patch repair protein)
MAALPYPTSNDEAVSVRMSRNRRRDTKPERATRRALHADGLRFRVDHPLQINGLRVRPDVVFTRWRVALFIDGCFWHSCPEHGNSPRRNREYWIPKLQRNLDRDRRIDAALREAGWQVVRVWEHEPIDDVVNKVHLALDQARVAT